MIPVLGLLGLGLFVIALLCHQISRRAPLVLAAWLATEPYANPLFSNVTSALAASGERWAALFADILTLDRMVIGAFLLVLVVEAARGRRVLPGLSAMEGTMALFSLVLLVNVALLANNKDHALRTVGDAFIFPFALAFVARAVVVDRRSFLVVLGGVAFLGLLLVEHGLIERWLAADRLYKIHGPVAHKALFGAVTVVLFFALLPELRDTRLGSSPRGPTRFAFELAVHLLPAVLFFTLHRGAWLAFLLGIGLWLWRGRGILSMKRVAGVALASGLVLGGWGLSMVDECTEPALDGRPSTCEQFVEKRVVNTRTMDYRLRAWLRLMPTLTERPLSGMGIGNSRDYLAVHRPPRERSARDAHSGYLSILFESGSIGFLLFLSIQFVIVSRAIRLAGDLSEPSHRWAGLAILALTLAYSIPATTDNTFYRANVGNFVYYALVGCLAAGAPGRWRCVDA